MSNRDNVRELELSACRIALEVRNEYAERLDRAKLEPQVGLLKHFHDGLLSAELRVSFLREGDLVDALEALIIKNGMTLVSDVELTTWLREGMRA